MWFMTWKRGSLEGSGEVSCAFGSQDIGFSAKKWAYLWPRHIYAGSHRQSRHWACCNGCHSSPQHNWGDASNLQPRWGDRTGNPWRTIEPGQRVIRVTSNWCCITPKTRIQKKTFLFNDIWVMVSTRKPLQMFCFPPTEKRFRQGEGNASRLQSRSSLLKCWDSSVREERGAATKTVLGNTWTTPETFREDAF